MLIQNNASHQGEGQAVADAGIRPDQFVLESWINAPSRIVPETTEFSFTRSVRDFGRKYIAPGSNRENPNNIQLPRATKPLPANPRQPGQ